MAETQNHQSLEYYKSLHYPVTLIRADEGGFVAKVKDLPYCVTQGETVEEVMGMIEGAKNAWLEDAYGDGDPIPLPQS